MEARVLFPSVTLALEPRLAAEDKREGWPAGERADSCRPDAFAEALGNCSGGNSWGESLDMARMSAGVIGEDEPWVRPAQ